MRAGREGGLFSVIILLGLTFAVIAPLIAAVCAFFFLTNFIIWRYHLLYVYERGYESNGTVFYSCAELIMWSLVIAQTFVSSVLFSKSAYAPAMFLYLTVPYYLYTSWQKCGWHDLLQRGTLTRLAALRLGKSLHQVLR